MSCHDLPSMSAIGSHGRTCCAHVLAWLESRDSAEKAIMPAGLPAEWLQQTFAWGPSRWPFFWCDLVAAETIDCGVFADLTQYLLTLRGYDVARVQLVERSHRSQTKHWAKVWRDAGCDPSVWIIDPETVYHEALAVDIGGVVRIFDPTENVAVGSQTSTAGPPIRMRLVESVGPANSVVRWNGVELRLGEWVDIPPARESRDESRHVAGPRWQL